MGRWWDHHNDKPIIVGSLSRLWGGGIARNQYWLDQWADFSVVEESLLKIDIGWIMENLSAWWRNVSERKERWCTWWTRKVHDSVPMGKSERENRVTAALKTKQIVQQHQKAIQLKFMWIPNLICVYLRTMMRSQNSYIREQNILTYITNSFRFAITYLEK